MWVDCVGLGFVVIMFPFMCLLCLRWLGVVWFDIGRFGWCFDLCLWVCC